MAEAMTSELVIEAYWLLQGFWTKLRFPFKTEKGQWSDVDVLAYHPEDKHLVIAESKVQGDKWNVFAFTRETRKSCDDILRYDEGAYLSFLDRIPTICADGAIFKNFQLMVDHLTVQLVSNYFITDDVKSSQIDIVSNSIRRHVPKAVTLDVQLDSTLEIICKIVGLESESEQGRRYGHPVLDIARELNRYIYAEIRYAGDSKSKQAVKEQISTLLAKTFCPDSEEEA